MSKQPTRFLTAARINIQTEIVNGERGHLVWSVRVNVVAMIRVSKLLGSNYNTNPKLIPTLISY